MNKIRFAYSFAALVGLVAFVLPHSGFAEEGDATIASPLGTAISYQGKLDKNGVPVNGNCNFIFGLFDAMSLLHLGDLSAMFELLCLLVCFEVLQILLQFIVPCCMMVCLLPPSLLSVYFREPLMCLCLQLF